jgi:hypothetical protein
MNLVDARAFGPDALSTECVALCAPATYLLFKLAHVGLASANALLASADSTARSSQHHAPHSDSDSDSNSDSDSDSDSNSDVSHSSDDAFARHLQTPRRWPRRWTAPTPQHAAFFKHAFLQWGPRDDGLLACASVSLPCAREGEGAGAGLMSVMSAEEAVRVLAQPRLRLHVRLDDRGVPLCLARFMEAPLSRSLLLDVARFYSSLTCRVAASLVVPLAFEAACAPRLFRVTGATAGSRAIEPPAHHDGQLAALWDLRGSDAELRAWELPPHLRGHVGAWAFVCPVRAAGRPAALLCCPYFADAGLVHGDWASGLLPEHLWELCKRGARVPHAAADTLALPWLPVLSARARVPALEGLAHPRTAHPQHPRGSQNSMSHGHADSAAVIDTASLRVTLAWSAELAPLARPLARRPRDEARVPLALPEALGLAFIIVLLADADAEDAGADSVLACVLAPGHILGRAAVSATAKPIASPTPAAPIATASFRSFIPWGRQ